MDVGHYHPARVSTVGPSRITLVKKKEIKHQALKSPFLFPLSHNLEQQAICYYFANL